VFWGRCRGESWVALPGKRSPLDSPPFCTTLTPTAKLSNQSPRAHPSPAPPKATLPPLMMQQFSTPESVSWPGSSTYTQLLTVATVCNKAKYDDSAGECAIAEGRFLSYDRHHTTP
jgi:hypothetical protein